MIAFPRNIVKRTMKDVSFFIKNFVKHSNKVYKIKNHFLVVSHTHQLSLVFFIRFLKRLGPLGSKALRSKD
jgi:hypothetical protein